MPPRKKNNGATANKPLEPTRRSTRTSKKTAPYLNDSSGDELTPQNLALQENSTQSTKVDNPRQEDIAEAITVRTTRARSRTSSRPSTANSDALSQTHRLRVLTTPVEREDVVMLDVEKDGEQDELVGEAPIPKKTRASVKETPTSARKGRSKYDNPDEMLTNPRAPLATVNLRNLLCSSKAWDVLNAEEKQEVLAKFPDGKEILDSGTEDARPNAAALANNDNFRNDVARYQEDLSKGWHDPEWIRQAQAAHRKREVGAYNEYLSARFENDWGMALPVQEEEEEEAAHETRGSWGSPEIQEARETKRVQEHEESHEMAHVEEKSASEKAKAENEEKDQDPDTMQGIESSSHENQGDGTEKNQTAQEASVQKTEQQQPPDTLMV